MVKAGGLLHHGKCMLAIGACPSENTDKDDPAKDGDKGTSAFLRRLQAGHVFPSKEPKPNN